MFRKVLSLFGPLALFLSILALTGGTVHAARSADSLVLVAKDVTTSTDCHLTYRTNIGTSSERVTSVPCPAGTHIATFKVPLSVAQANHQAFISLTSAKEQEVDALVNAARIAAQHTATPLLIVPHTNCGNSSSVFAGWNSSFDRNVYYQAYVHFYREAYPNCNTVYMDDSYIVNNGSGLSIYGWSEYNGHNVINDPYQCAVQHRYQYLEWNPQTQDQVGHTWQWETTNWCIYGPKDYFHMPYEN